MGIIKKELIDSFKYGILNFHPGDCPQYRGCSAPEWQLWEKKPVICTCHLVDSGIDTGKIYRKKVLDVNRKDYYKMRSQIYPEISKFVCDIITNLDEGFVKSCIDQDERYACYREYIGNERINSLIKKMSNGEV